MKGWRSSEHRWVRSVSWFAACVPLCLILAVALSEAYVRLSFGRWPVIYRDSVHTRFAEAAGSTTALSVIALLPSALLLPLVAVSRALSGVRPVFGRWAVFFGIGWLAALFLFRWDPNGFIDWVLD